jgi:hypothetical protein
MESVDTIFAKYNTDKNNRGHNYSRQYEDLFRKYREKPIVYLEIGIFEGESLKAMREVFKNAKYIIGIDINPDCKKYEDLEKNIFVEIGDASSENFIKSVISKYSNFDVILDDGSHINKDVIKSFEMLFPYVSNEGLYVVEDTHTARMTGYVNNSYPNQMSYFTKFIPGLNIVDDKWCSDPFKFKRKAADIFEATIDKVEFGVSYIGIHKLIRTTWL